MVHFFLLNDLHLSERTEETVFSILSYVAAKARQQESCVAILGDMYDTVYKDGQVDARLQQRLYNFFADHFVDDQLYLLAGNHDMYNGYQESALSIFRSVAKVYDTPTVDENKILWLPYKDGGYTSDMFKKWKREGAFICFTHNDIKYLSTRKNNISREGMIHQYSRICITFSTVTIITRMSMSKSLAWDHNMQYTRQRYLIRSYCIKFQSM